MNGKLLFCLLSKLRFSVLFGYNSQFAIHVRKLYEKKNHLKVQPLGSGGGFIGEYFMTRGGKT